MSEREQVAEAVVPVHALDEHTLFLCERLATAKVGDATVEIMVNGVTLFIYGRDGRPGVVTNMRPVIEALVEAHMAVGA